VCPEDGFSIVAFTGGGVCGGVDLCCVKDGVMEEDCNRFFFLDVKLVDESPELDELNRNGSTYTFLPYPNFSSSIEPEERTIHIPLGRPFKIEYSVDEIINAEDCIAGNREIVDSTYTITEAVNNLTSFNPSDPLDLKYVLYKDDVVVPLGASDNPKEVEFMPVHLGTTTITLIPTNPEFPRWNLRVIVESPLFLGKETGYTNDNQELHEYITLVAHLSGFPPQLLKGWIQKETFALTDHFNPRTYRYEPGYQRIYVDNNRDAAFRKAFSPYALKEEAKGWIMNGDSILSPFWDPPLDYRNRFLICTANCSGPENLRQYRNIERGDLDSRTITVRDIITANRKYKYPLHVASDFTAQTIISSSYGLLNMMFPTYRLLLASRLKRIRLDAPIKSSSDLIDTYANLVIGGLSGLPSGSLFLSTANLVYSYYGKYNAVWKVDTRGVEEYFKSFTPLLGRHNPKEVIYSKNVVDNSKNYLPRPAKCVINDGEICR
jgi:hypothetical protein